MISQVVLGQHTFQNFGMAEAWVETGRYALWFRIRLPAYWGLEALCAFGFRCRISLLINASHVFQRFGLFPFVYIPASQTIHRLGASVGPSLTQGAALG